MTSGSTMMGSPRWGGVAAGVGSGNEMMELYGTLPLSAAHSALYNDSVPIRIIPSYSHEATLRHPHILLQVACCS